MLEDEEDLFRSINYVGQNPEKEGKKPQRWSFVVPFDVRDVRVVNEEETESRPRVGGAALRSHILKREREARRRKGDNPQ
jgi:hypothetical protein